MGTVCEAYLNKASHIAKDLLNGKKVPEIKPSDFECCMYPCDVATRILIEDGLAKLKNDRTYSPTFKLKLFGSYESYEKFRARVDYLKKGQIRKVFSRFEIAF